ncbi:MAG: ribosome biogenesis GTPase Der, partial [Actinobacteria bacterium]|nr:ribosome biogenesis GTPase Der [Actinomycetota bacterium]
DYSPEQLSESEINRVLSNHKISPGTTEDFGAIGIDGKDVSKLIRTLEISELSSRLSSLVTVRNYLLKLQRMVIDEVKAIRSGIVVEGRDIGSVVMPDADFKFYLTASAEIRAERRSLELGVNSSEIVKHINERDNRDTNRKVSPLILPPDAVIIDTSQLSLEQCVERILYLVSINEEPSTVTDYELDSGTDLYLPVVAVLGRPNVGKSTLVNRLIGQRSAVTEDQPGVTRDRVSYETEWNHQTFVVVDTGGWDPKALGMYEQVARQAEFAITQADLCLLVIDVSVGATDDDLLLIKKLREAKQPVILVANKVDSAKEEADASLLWSLGLGEPFAISALHGRGAGDLLDLIVEKLPKESESYEKHPSARSIAILGRPNVGKSSLLNRLVGSERAVVSDVSGTTVDPIDEYVKIGDYEWLFIDTAGIRKKFKQDSGHEYYAVLRTQATIDRAEVVIVLIDSAEELSDQDRRIINMIQESGKAIVLCFNKWDLVDEERRIEIDREIDKDLQQQKWIPRLNISASTGRGVLKIPDLLNEVLDNWNRRIPTSELNRLIKDFVSANPHPLRGGRQPKILFATQVGIKPPTFALFTSRLLDDGYIKFLERVLREQYDFTGAPIRFKQRLRGKN